MMLEIWLSQVANIVAVTNCLLQTQTILANRAGRLAVVRILAWEQVRV